MPFEPGQSGNPGGRAAERAFLNALRRIDAQSDGQKLRDTAAVLWDKAIAGESWAVQMVAERYDGKVAQALEHSGPEGGAIQVVQMPEITREEWFRLHSPAAIADKTGE